MQKLKIITAISGGIWLFSVVMVFIFPRVRYPALSTVFAILFWLSLVVTCFFAYLLISNMRQRKSRNSLSAHPRGNPKSAGQTVPDSYRTKQNSPEGTK